MKIIIVGGGMAGLTTYLSLKKHLPPSATHDITIYERHSSNDISNPSSTVSDSASGKPPDRIVAGGGLGIAPNGMRLLQYLSPAMYDRIVAAGFPSAAFEIRSVGDSALGSFSAGTGEFTLITSWRALWDEIRKELPAKGVVITGKKVAAVDSQGLVTFEDGEKVQADLVIGADGAKSVCRRAVLEEGEAGQDPEFQGLIGFGGFVPTAELPTVPSEMVMTFGAKGFFGYTPCNTSPQSQPGKSEPGDMAMWWSTCSSATPQCPPPASAETRQTLLDRHSECSNPVIKYIIENVTPDLSTPTWVVPKLPRWSKGRVVLVGDAAHALPTTSGQGVSQAFEDVVTLGMLLGAAVEMSHGKTLDEERLEETAQHYIKLRKPRVEEILDEATRMQMKKRDMTWWELKMMYAVMWIAMKFFSNKSLAKLIEYNAKDGAEAEVKSWKAAAGTKS